MTKISVLRPKRPSRRFGVKEEHTASWFSHENRSANQSRDKLAQDSLEMLIQWLKEGGNVGIHGAPPKISWIDYRPLS
jgi:6-phosphofructo-2-kinase/fructose-2,6-biphosphatase 2